jgi:hypothetical protein
VHAAVWDRVTEPQPISLNLHTHLIHRPISRQRNPLNASSDRALFWSLSIAKQYQP